MTYSDQEQLQQITSALLLPVLEIALPGHKTWSLSKNIAKLAGTMVGVYVNTAQKFTTDMYQHYIFTPRDLSRLVISLKRHFRGASDDTEMLEVVSYEFQRLFQDRLVGADSKLKFSNILFSTLRSEWDFQKNETKIIFSTSPNAVVVDSGLNIRPLTRTDFINYEIQVRKQLIVYERDVKELSIKLFPELLEQISRIEKVLGEAGGSILLAGRPGISYPSLVNLASNSLGYTMKSPKVSKFYSYKLFLVDIKEALYIAVYSGQNVVFILEDFQMVLPSFLELINTLLSGSDVMGIYSQDEWG
jgi:dynein heavy chain 2